MYRLLIVDDEPIITDGLYEVFKAEKDCELDLYKAYSGDEALEWLNRSRVDIVLSDIRMPGMNGLQLMEKIKSNWPECKIIFLTGYNEFDYVYKAIQYSGVSYLLKTEEHEKIVETVKRAIIEIENTRKFEHLVGQAKVHVDRSEYLLQKDFITQIMNNNEPCTILQRQLDELGIGMRANFPVMMLLGCMLEASSDTLYSERLQDMNMVKQIAASYFGNMVSSFFIPVRRNEFLWFIQPLNANMESNDDLVLVWDKVELFVSGTLEVIQDICVKTLDKKLSFVIGSKAVLWSEMYDEYCKLKRVFVERIGDSNKEIIFSMKDYRMSEQVIQRDENIKQSHRNLKKLELVLFYLDRGDRESLILCLQELTAGLHYANSFNDNLAVEIYMSIALMLLSYINAHHLTEKIAFHMGLKKLTRLDEHNSWDEAIRYLVELASLLFDLRVLNNEKSENESIIKVQMFIEENLSKDVSLVRLSELVHFNPTYLSRMFKQKKGITLSDYIDELRIEKAKQLLSLGDSKIHEIAEIIGFESSTNFGRFFKKKIGVTPQEYRESTVIRNMVNESR